eukprot:scaffold1691_cov378-Prasinococcus_capsulatus_cf.AAC.10
MGLWPASARYLAHDRPASPPPTMATVFGSTPFSPRDLSFLDSAAAARKFSESRSGLGKSLAVTRRRRGAAARKACCWRRSGRAWPMRARGRANLGGGCQQASSRDLRVGACGRAGAMQCETLSGARHALVPPSRDERGAARRGVERGVSAA